MTLGESIVGSAVSRVAPTGPDSKKAHLHGPFSATGQPIGAANLDDRAANHRHIERLDETTRSWMAIGCRAQKPTVA